MYGTCIKITISTCFHHFTLGCLADVSEIEASVLHSPVSFEANNCIYNANEIKSYSFNSEDGGSMYLRNYGKTSLFHVILRHQNRLFTQDDGDCSSNCPLNILTGFICSKCRHLSPHYSLQTRLNSNRCFGTYL